MPHPSTPIQRFRFQQNFKGSENRPLTSPRSPMGMNSKLNIDPKNVDCLQLCMDVPFPDHPYLIGPRGRKSQYFMTRYKSLLHFPDANCRNDGLKLNNVLISGTMKNVEEIRAQIRLRTPIRVIVQLSQFSNVKQLVNRVEEAVSQRSLPIRFNVSEDLKTAVLKTEWRNEELLVDFADEFLNNTKQLRANREELFTLGIALLPLINPWNHELSHRLIGSFYEQTGCRIFYPPKDKYAVQPPTYFIKGASMLGVLKATKYLMGLTMLQITFYLPPGTMPSIKQHQLDDWQRDHLVHTTIYNPEQNAPVPQFKIVLRSFEFSINGLYFVRSTLLGFKKSIQTSCYDFMKSTKYLIPYTVFMDAKLYYPLYSVDNKNLNWNCHEFFNHFYGSPYSKQYEQQQQFDKIHHHLPPEQMMLMAPPPPPSLMHPPHHLMIQQQQPGIEETSELEHQQNGHGPQQQMLEGMQTPKQKGDATTINPYTPANVRVIHLSQLGSAGGANSSTQSTPPYIDVMLHTCDHPHSSPEQQSTSSSSFNTTISPDQPFHHLPPYVHMKPLPRNDPLSLLQW